MSEHIRNLSTTFGFCGAGDVGALEALFDEPALEPRSRPVFNGSIPELGENSAEYCLVQAYRDRGFLAAKLDPLGLSAGLHAPELAPEWHLLNPIAAAALVDRMQSAYCGSIGWEFGHIHDQAKRAWLQERAERAPRSELGSDQQGEILALLSRTQAFETALAKRLPGAKLFGLAGAETFNVMIETLLAESARHGIETAVIGGMHRGRFNMLANVLGKPLLPLIAEIIGKAPVPEAAGLSSDVPYHFGYEGWREFGDKRLEIIVLPHPSHLQLAPVIAQGFARGVSAASGANGRSRVLPLLLHTDASFAGQGLVAEMLQLSGLGPFALGGTIHVVINNQLGFTTPPEEARTARHPTDIAKLIEAPVLHVNCDDPEAVVRVARTAVKWRAAFASDIVIDLVCYRRPGHNEIDEPRFTQPLMYRAIEDKPTVVELYMARLAWHGGNTEIAQSATATMVEQVRAACDAALSYSVDTLPERSALWCAIASGSEADLLRSPCTGVAFDALRALGRSLTTPPDGFNGDPKVRKFLDDRRQTIEAGTGLGWATAEALALASLLAEGTPVRFGGQDSVRGAFTQRHLEVHDQSTGARHLVLAGVVAAGDICEVHNTPLIEHAVLCYEYGLSLADPRRLVVWEAQFGEFLNIAQPVFDQCIVCGEDRWLKSSGLVILLPHGLDGGGPDHSTGRPERLLAACAGGNICVANVSTPANFFHLLRRQIHWPFRKPLVVLTPKHLLRNKACVSDISEMADGTSFRPVIDDGGVASAQRVVLCTGKVYYDLAAARAARGLADDIALIRIEQLYPFPVEALRAALSAHPGGDVVWCEEEPENMGYYLHLRAKLEEVAGRPVRRVGRRASPTPATGVKAWLDREARALIDEALALIPTGAP